MRQRRRQRCDGVDETPLRLGAREIGRRSALKRYISIANGQPVAVLLSAWWLTMLHRERISSSLSTCCGSRHSQYRSRTILSRSSTSFSTAPFGTFAPTARTPPHGPTITSTTTAAQEDHADGSRWRSLSTSGSTVGILIASSSAALWTSSSGIS